MLEMLTQWNREREWFNLKWKIGLNQPCTFDIHQIAHRWRRHRSSLQTKLTDIFVMCHKSQWKSMVLNGLANYISLIFSFAHTLKFCDTYFWSINVISISSINLKEQWGCHMQKTSHMQMFKLNGNQPTSL